MIFIFHTPARGARADADAAVEVDDEDAVRARA